MNKHDKEVLRYHSLHTKNILAQDTALLQLSVGLIAVLSTLGSSILKVNKTLTYIVFISLGLTISLVVIGYYLSNKFFVEAKQKIKQNEQQHPDEHTNYGLENIIFGKINNWLNSAQLATFFIGMLSFGALLLIYLKGI